VKDITFYVPGLPVAKARARITKEGRAFPSRKTEVYESLVRQSFAAKNPDFEPMTEPVNLYVSFYFSIPESAKRKKGPDKILPDDPFIIRPDLDNLVKSILDGLNTVAFVDDKQIVGIFAAKKYGMVPGAYVSLRPARGGNHD
jgi:Holliday junction resolvase RusA-like endonuclease